MGALFARAFSVSTPLHSFSRPFSEFRNNLLKILLKTWRYLKKQPFIVLKLFDTFWFLPFLRQFSSKLWFGTCTDRLRRVLRSCLLPIGWNMCRAGAPLWSQIFPATSAADLSRTGKGKKKLFRKSVRCENVFNFYKTDPFTIELFDKNVNEGVFPIVR